MRRVELDHKRAAELLVCIIEVFRISEPSQYMQIHLGESEAGPDEAATAVRGGARDRAISTVSLGANPTATQAYGAESRTTTGAI